MFVLVNFIISVLLGLTGIRALSGLYSLLLLIPGLAVGVRRLHDTDRSGWWLLLGFIPVVGAIVLIVFAAQKGTAGANKYGPPATV